MDAPTSAITTRSSDLAPLHDERLLGTILVDADRLTQEDAERVDRVGRELGLRFGEAAIQLGLVVPADIDFALSRQFGHSCVQRGESRIAREVIAAFGASGPKVEALHALRSRILLGWPDRDSHQNALTVISAEREEGRSFIAANLAVVFSQLGGRTLLIDADMRRPRQHTLFGLENRLGLSAILSGRSGTGVIQSVHAIDNLSVLPAGALPPNPLDLLARPVFSQLLRDLQAGFDFILVDTPPAAQYADAQTVAMRTGFALLVVRKNSARVWDVRGVVDTVVQPSCTVLGAVFNDF